MLERLKKQLNELNAAQIRALADASGVPEPTIIKIKYNQTLDPRCSTVEKLSRWIPHQRQSKS